MATNIAVGDWVHVPKTALGLDPNEILPFYRTIVRARCDRSAQVDMPSGALSPWIGTSLISAKIGVFIVRVGDFNKEGLIDPLNKSLLHFARILLPGDLVRSVEVRTLGELREFWLANHSLYEQIVLVGHGAASSILFGKGEATPDAVASALTVANGNPKETISVCCQTGRAEFAKAFSSTGCCSDFIAPYDSIHGCLASLFVQNYLASRLLHGHTIGTAFNRSRRGLLGTAGFRWWKNGILKEGKL